MAPWIAPARSNRPQLMSRCFELGGSSSSMSPQSWSNTFLPTKPASSAPDTDTGMNRSFAMGALYPDGVARMSAALGQVGGLDGHLEPPRREAAAHTAPSDEARPVRLRIAPDDPARD